MGCDIHGVFQAKKNGKWFDIEHCYDEDRHYQLFAVLAGVRNGVGFAGCRTGDAVTPISSPRGFPEDFQVKEDCHPIEDLSPMSPRRRAYFSKGDNFEIWMGDHSHSWLTAEEMLSWYAPTVTKNGVITKEEYEKWDKKSRPESYCGDVFGGGVVVTDDPQSIGWTHIRVTWDSDLKTELSYFFDAVAKLKERHGEVRYIFGFDS